MYLARQPNGDYVIRESVPRHGGWYSRDIQVLGTEPAAFLHYPGHNAYYVDPDLVDLVEARAERFDDAELDRLFRPFVRPDLRRILDRFERPRPRPGGPRSSSGGDDRSRVHPFDQRRLHFLRYGQIDQPRVFARPPACFDQALGKSRDEIECLIAAGEECLAAQDLKTYVYVALDLPRFFPGRFTRLMPGALDPVRVDELFVREVCALNQDRGFLTEGFSEDGLADYLVKYVVMYFDSSFGGPSPEQAYIADFIRRRRVHRTPPRLRLGRDRACAVLGITPEDLGRLDKIGLTRLFRRLAKAAHPDRGGDADRFIALTEAYAELLALKS